MQGKKVLIVDDDIEVCHSVEDILILMGAKTLTAYNGQEALHKFFDYRPDLIILDINMPIMNGWEACEQIRKFSTTPIIMLTANDRNEDIIKGLDVGADDFISKPFDTGVLRARAQAVLRRATKSLDSSNPVTFQDDYLEISLAKRQVLVAGKAVKLTVTEYDLLAYLVQNAGYVLTYEQILKHVWGSEYLDSPDYVQVYMSYLRRKIEKNSRSPRYLLTEHGIGYKFVP